MNQHINDQTFHESVIEEMNERMSKSALGSCYTSISKYFGINYIVSVYMHNKYIAQTMLRVLKRKFFRCINSCIHMMHMYIHTYLHYVTFLDQDL